jgi:SAM-dependent methyltransferase
LAAWPATLRKDDAPTGFFRSVVPRGTIVASRDDALLEIVRNERVVHVGCTDWPITEVQLERQLLLHRLVLGTARAVLGIDIDAEGLRLLEEALGGDYLCRDISEDLEMEWVDEFSPTIVLACDVIEHVPNLDRFVAGLARLLGAAQSGARLVITTPNGLAFRNVVNTAAGLEMIHPDHRVVFTPSTLKRVLSPHNLVVTRWAFYSIAIGSSLSRRLVDTTCRVACLLRPAYADGMLVEVSLGSGGDRSGGMAVGRTDG